MTMFGFFDSSKPKEKLPKSIKVKPISQPG